MRRCFNGRFILCAFVFLVLSALVLIIPGNGIAAASGDDSKVELIYFYPRFRCLSCEQVDSYAAEAAAGYENNGVQGIPYTRLAIDDPANREKVEEYGVVGSSLFLVTATDGEETFRELQKVWFLWEDREGCISYIQSEVDAAFDETASASSDPGYPFAGIPLLAALVLGLLTAVSPCPLATNIAAVAYISKGIEDRRKTALSGILYTAGRAFSYIILGLALVYLGVNVVHLSGFLRNSAVYYLGPLLIFIALVMLDVIKLHIFRGGLATKLGERLSGKGLTGSFLLGAVFALSFCPYSAILFFGMLIPLAIEVPAGGVYIPAAYAVGTGLPVLVIALFIAFSVAQWAKHVEKVQAYERYFRKLAALIFLGVGIYYVVVLIKTLA